MQKHKEGTRNTREFAGLFSFFKSLFWVLIVKEVWVGVGVGVGVWEEKFELEFECEKKSLGWSWSVGRKVWVRV